MDNNEENNEELVVNPVVDDNANSNIDEELEEIKFQKLNDEAMRANEKILTLEDIIASPEHQLTIIYGDDSILNISKVGDIMNDMRPITTDKKTLSSSNIVIPPVNPKLKNINNSPNGFVSVDVYSGIIIPEITTKESNPTTDGPIQSQNYSNAVGDEFNDENRLGADDLDKSISENYSSEVIEAYNLQDKTDDTDEITDEDE